MDQFQSIDAFVRVAEVGSFAEVARQLHVSKSVVTSRVQQLEEFVGSPLFHRSTRNVRLSEVGEAYYHECAQLISRANDVVDQMRKFGSSPAGELRIHGITGFVLEHMPGFLARFQRQYPGITFDFVINDAVVDPVKEGFDCALQLFAPISDDLVQKRLFPIRRVFCASPDYLAQHGPVLHPLELVQHPLGLYSRYPAKDRWIFSDGVEKFDIELDTVVRTNSVHLLKEFAHAGGAIVCLPTMVAAADILAGRLQPILVDYELPPYWFSAVYPKTQRNSTRLRLFLEHFTEAFADVPPWDRALLDKGILPAPSPTWI